MKTAPFLLGLLLGPLVALAPGLALAEDAGSAPPRTSMSDDEMAHLVNVARLVAQDLDDFAGWEAADQEAMESYRYQIAFASYALAFQQYHSVPAWREVHRATADRLLQKMLRKPVWEFWAEVSKTRRDYDPDWEGEQPSKHDPVGEKNIMYSGHLVHMAALYEMFYRDDKWSKPGAFTFRWDENEAYEYDYPTLLKRIHAEMLAERSAGGACVAGVECEPNLIFPECNQHPLLAFQLHDALHGTSMHPEARKRLGEFFECVEMYDPKTGAVANSWRVKQARIIRLPSPTADGWTGAFMHSWDPATIRARYEAQRARNVRINPDGTILFPFDPMFHLGSGFFALLAAELGDQATAEAIYAHCEKTYSPVREDGGLRYPPAVVGKERVSNTLDKVLMMAKSNRPNGIVDLHERPWGDSEANQPLVEGIDFPRVLVAEARWSADGRALTLELAPGPDAPERASFRVAGAGLDVGANWTLAAGEEVLGSLGPDGIATGALARDHAARAITADVALASEGRTRLELRRN